MSVIRPVTLDDAPALGALLRADREFFAPWDPVRSEEYFTDDGQRDDVRAALRRAEEGQGVVYVIVHDGAVAGRIALSNVVRGPLQSANLGYWVTPALGGRGLATAAVREMKRVAFDELRLHRLEAGTLRHNAASQRVLARNGFERFGMAPRYLRIAGRWQDMDLFQVVDDDWSE